MKLKVGVIGLGSMGKNHLRVLNKIENVEVVIVYDINPADEYVQKLGIHIARSEQEFYETKLDYAVVAVPTNLHSEISIRLANLKVPTLIEKPISNNLLKAKEIISEFDKNRVLAAVGHIERFNSGVREAKRRLRQLGEVYQIITRRESPFPGRISDVGVTMDLASHDIDLTEWITNESYSFVYAQTSQHSKFDHEDLLVCSASLSNGTKVNHIVNWLSPRKMRSISILGKEGALDIDTLNSKLTFFANGNSKVGSSPKLFEGASEGDIVSYAFEKKEALLVEHENFRDAVLGKPAEIVSLKEGLRVVEIAQAMLDSSKKNSVVDVRRSIGYL